MTDKKQGVARLFGNVLIMLSALILIPSLLLHFINLTVCLIL